MYNYHCGHLGHRREEHIYKQSEHLQSVQYAEINWTVWNSIYMTKSIKFSHILMGFKECLKTNLPSILKLLLPNVQLTVHCCLSLLHSHQHFFIKRNFSQFCIFLTLWRENCLPRVLYFLSLRIISSNHSSFWDSVDCYSAAFTFI